MVDIAIIGIAAMVGIYLAGYVAAWVLTRPLFWALVIAAGILVALCGAVLAMFSFQILALGFWILVLWFLGWCLTRTIS